VQLSVKITSLLWVEFRLMVSDKVTVQVLWVYGLLTTHMEALELPPHPRIKRGAGPSIHELDLAGSTFTTGH